MFNLYSANSCFAVPCNAYLKNIRFSHCLIGLGIRPLISSRSIFILDSFHWRWRFIVIVSGVGICPLISFSCSLISFARKGNNWYSRGPASSHIQSHPDSCAINPVQWLLLSCLPPLLYHQYLLIPSPLEGNNR